VARFRRNHVVRIVDKVTPLTFPIVTEPVPCVHHAPIPACTMPQSLRAPYPNSYGAAKTFIKYGVDLKRFGLSRKSRVVRARPRDDVMILSSAPT
jgi:hypothetical protein